MLLQPGLSEFDFLVVFLTPAIKAGKELALKVQGGYQGGKIGTQTRFLGVIQTSKLMCLCQTNSGGA